MMELPPRYDALIIDPDTSTRMRLKQAASSVAEFDKVFLAPSLSEGTSRLNSGGQIDVYFLSAALERKDIDTFIAQSKAHKNGQDGAYVFVMKGNSQAGSEIAGNVISGFDGMLFEPYSVDQLVEMTRIAARVRKERSGAREQAAIGLIVQDLVKLTDQMAVVKSQGIDPQGLMKKFRQNCDTLRRLETRSLNFYFSALVEAYCAAQLPTSVLSTKSYAGPSKRIQKMQKEKLAEEVRKLEEPTV